MHWRFAPGNHFFDGFKLCKLLLELFFGISTDHGCVDRILHDPLRSPLDVSPQEIRPGDGPTM
jgi:hypothetical protein